jgi:Lrp/AsnC family leucine-responsive transcriptional regulator
VAGDESSRGSGYDDLDRALIESLREDPRISYATLGARLGVTGMTVANRLQRLRNNGYLRFKVVPDLKGSGLRTAVIGLVQVDASAIAGCIEVLRASPWILRLDRVTGEYDLAFRAAFPSEAAMGQLVRDIQALPGIRRLIVHHEIGVAKDEEGWAAVWAEEHAPEASPIEFAPGARVPPHLREKFDLVTAWLDAFVTGDLPRLAALSTPGIIVRVLVPEPAAGTYEGIEAVQRQARSAARIFRYLWQRVVGISEPSEPYGLMIDEINTVERSEGQIQTAFLRMAFSFEGKRISRAITLSSMELADTSGIEHAPARPAAQGG